MGWGHPILFIATLIINNSGARRMRFLIRRIRLYNQTAYYMEKEKFKKIKPFAEFCKAHKTINENNVPNIKVEVEWWDDAISLILADLRDISGNPIVWSCLVDYCRTKFMALSREIPVLVENMVLAHIRDLIFQYYGRTFFNGEDLSGDSFETAALGTKLLVISQLGNEILDLVKIEAGIIEKPTEPEDSPNTVASVTLEDDSYYEDELPFERNVYHLDEFNKRLTEVYCHLELNNYNSILDKCLKELASAQEEGTLDYQKVLKAAKKEYDYDDDDKCIDKYLNELVKKQINKEKLLINGVEVDVLTPSTKHIFEAARNLFADNMVNDLKGRFKKK